LFHPRLTKRFIPAALVARPWAFEEKGREREPAVLVAMHKDLTVRVRTKHRLFKEKLRDAGMC